MARNTEKYVYLTIAILRGGETHQALQRDAQQHGTRQLPTLASIRLGDYYRLKEQGILYTPSTPEETRQAIQNLSSDLSPDLVENIAEADDIWPE